MAIRATMGNIDNHGGTAFPSGIAVDQDNELLYGTTGMSLRDYFAAQAMLRVNDAEATLEEVSAKCYRIADAMLVARKLT